MYLLAFIDIIIMFNVLYIYIFWLYKLTFYIEYINQNKTSSIWKHITVIKQCTAHWIQDFFMSIGTNKQDRSSVILHNSLLALMDVRSMVKFPKVPFSEASLTVSTMVFTVFEAADFFTASSYFTSTLPLLQNKTVVISKCGRCVRINSVSIHA